jgi:hypothetical protein
MEKINDGFQRRNRQVRLKGSNIGNLSLYEQVQYQEYYQSYYTLDDLTSKIKLKPQHLLKEMNFD